MLKYFWSQEEKDISFLIERARRLLREDPNLSINEGPYLSTISQISEKLKTYDGSRKDVLETRLDSLS